MSLLKMRVVSLLFLLLLSSQEFTESIRILQLRVADHVAEGGGALLSCYFDTEEEVLYSVKWYKDGHEFYRYVPRNIPAIRQFSVPGVIINLARSSSNVVTLVDLTRKSEGLYRCEVSGEAPKFTTVSKEKYVSVDLIPDTGPSISGLQEKYEIGDEVVLNCTSAPSRPEAQLKWLLNGIVVPREYIHGPSLKITTNGSGAPVQMKLRLRFKILPEHFVEGVMVITCQATVAPLYQQETNATYYLEVATTGTEVVVEENNKEDATVRISTLLIFFLSAILLISS